MAWNNTDKLCLCIRVLILGTVLSLTILSMMGCNLFINLPEADLEKKMDDAIAWAKADRLTVRVAATPWGSPNPPAGTVDSSITRKGFPFNVEFSTDPAYVFVEWLAIPAVLFEQYEDNGIDMGDLIEGALQEPDAVISGGRNASVTLNTSTPVVLLPLCMDRPRITQSNPPLIDTGISYSRGQEIKIYFDAPLDDETVMFGQGYIEIYAQTIGEDSGPYDDPDTPDVSENGDLTGILEGTSKFYKVPELDSSKKTITIRPGDGGTDGSKLPPGDVAITVTVGTKVLGINGNGMAASRSFYFRTNTLEVINKYVAENIWAIHKPEQTPINDDSPFFYAGAIPNQTNNYRDARLRKNGDDYEITLYFSVKATVAAMTDPPTHCTVREYRAFNLAGGITSNEGLQETYALATAETSGGSAGAYYRQRNDGVVTYRITHKLKTPNPQAGIWQLILTPYRDAAGVGDIAPDNWRNALAEGRYAAVVLDDLPPSGNAALTLNGQAQISGAGVYNYGINNQIMGFMANFGGITDNGSAGGILPDNASLDKPWTMDRQDNLQWQYRIVSSSGGEVYFPSPGTWLPISTNTISDINLLSAAGSSPDIRKIELRYRDNLDPDRDPPENVSGWIDSTIRLSYYEPVYTDISGWSAVYDPDNNTITVSWTNPTGAGFSRTEAWYSVNNMTEIRRTDLEPRATAFTITGVPRLNALRVREAIPVDNIYCYEIFLKAYSESDSKPAKSFKIWNFGTPGAVNSGMSVSQAYPAIEVTSAAGDNDASDGTISFVNMAVGDTDVKYVLANDIELSGTWSSVGFGEPTGTPVGNSVTATYAFKGKFYGNGKTITVSSLGVNGEDAGLFGCTDSNAEIRDLSVVYDNVSTASSSTINYLGGVVGWSQSNTILRNIIIAGSLTVGGGGNEGFIEPFKCLGGVAGTMRNATTVSNCLSTLDLTCTYTAAEESTVVRFGGLAGYAYLSGNNRTVISQLTVTGNLKLEQETQGNMYAGGVAGRINSTTPTDLNISDVEFSGALQINRNGSGVTANLNQIGGIAGDTVHAGLFNCRVSGSVEILSTFTTAGRVYLGGLVGNSDNTTIENSWVRGDIRGSVSNAQMVYCGGLIGYCSSSKFNNIWYEQGSIIATGNTQLYLYLGGAVGSIYTNNSFTNCRSLAALVSGSQTTQEVHVGGFAGGISDADLTGCYAQTDVYAEGTTQVSAGGLIGQWKVSTNNSSCSISECYATGNITASSNTSISAGGLIGLIGQNSYANTNTLNVKNCYALGNVAVMRGNAICAGGLVGQVMYYGWSTGTFAVNIQFCFTRGNVSAKNDNGYGFAYVGGIGGQKMDVGSLDHNAALGSSVTIMGGHPDHFLPENSPIGRIYGDIGDSGSKDKNYARDDMFLGKAAVYTNSPYPFYETIEASRPMDNVEDRDGGNVPYSNFMFAIVTSPWIDDDMLDFDSQTSTWPPEDTTAPATAVWNFGPVSRGYPVLAHVGGQ